MFSGEKGIVEYCLFNMITNWSNIPMLEKQLSILKCKQ